MGTITIEDRFEALKDRFTKSLKISKGIDVKKLECRGGFIWVMVNPNSYFYKYTISDFEEFTNEFECHVKTLK